MHFLQCSIYVISCSFHTRSLYETIETLDPQSLTPYEQGQPSLFADHLDTLMGFNGDKND